jgi:hypothetical protein
MNKLTAALLASVMVLLCPIAPAHADDPVEAVEENASAAVFLAMHDDLERCFANANGNAYVMVEALLDARGRVRRVEATGDGRAGLGTRRCVERRVARARFPVPRGGGTSRVRTSFVFGLDD